MNFPLEYIELYIQDSQIEMAENMLATGAPLTLMEVERNLWAGYLKIEKEYETEIKLVNKKVNRYSCECDTFKKEKLCTHIVASLLSLRQHLTQGDQKKKKEKSSRPNRLNTNVILKTVAHEDLVKFVKDYAKKNRNFALDLKTKFASQIPGTESADAYVQLLNSAISMYKNKDGNINSRGLKQIVQVCSELLKQAEDNLALKRYTEAYPIIQAILFKIPIFVKFDEEHLLEDIYITCIELIESIIAKDISPSFKKEIFNFLIEDIPTRSIFENKLEIPYLKTLLSLGILISETSSLYPMLEEWKSTIPLSKSNLVNLLVLNINLLERDNKKEEAQILIEENLSQSSILFIAIEEAKKNDDWKKIRQISLSSLKKVTNVENKEIIHDLLYESAIKLNLEDEVNKYAIIRFLESYDFKYIEKLSESLDESSTEALYNDLLVRLNEQTYSKSKRNSIAEIYFRTGNLKTLFEYIEKLGSLELIHLFDERLLPKRKRKVYSLYKKLVINYLNNHLGRVPAQKIAKIIQHLKAIGAHDLVYDLTGLLKNEYAERHSLMDEINFL